MKVAILDCETEGLVPSEICTVIELATILCDTEDQEDPKPLDFLSYFNDPGRPLEQHIKDLTGIEDEWLRGEKIDVPQVQALLDRADVVIAKNSAFDRGFIEPLGLTAKRWGCANIHIPWEKYLFMHGKSQRLLMFEHGLTPSSHRALSDCEDLWRLLQCSPKDRLVQRPATEDGRYLDTLLRNMEEEWFLCVCTPPYDLRQVVKDAGFSWSSLSKRWYRLHSKSEGAAIKQLVAGFSPRWLPADPTDSGLLRRNGLE